MKLYVEQESNTIRFGEIFSGGCYSIGTVLTKNNILHVDILGAQHRFETPKYISCSTLSNLQSKCYRQHNVQLKVFVHFSALYCLHILFFFFFFQLVCKTEMTIDCKKKNNIDFGKCSNRSNKTVLTSAFCVES